MPGRPAETLPQREFVLRLRYAIDTARAYPSQRNRDEALELARSQPRALHSSHARHNLGGLRWEWLGANGIHPIGEPGQLEGEFKATITPEVTK
jgi:hypothetical protein